jgi:RNA polymerase sigma factor (sigma-70 family)
MDEPLRLPSAPLDIGDERLARLVTAGNDQAFSTLYGRYREVVYRYCRSILLHEADAHDAVQSTFTRALAALQRGQRDAPLRPWLFRIAHNESISMLRRRKATRELYSHLGPLSVSVDERVGHREQVGLLLDDLQELPPRQRGAIVMRELWGMSHEEIGSALGLTVSGARQAIFEARAALNEFAEGRAMACADVRRELSAGDRRVMRRRPIRAHLRDCAACAAFAADLRGRSAGLSALVAPVVVAPARLLGRLLASGSSGAIGASSGAGGLTSALGSLGGLAVKPIAALVIGLTAAGTGTVIYGLSERGRPSPPRPAGHVVDAASATAGASVVPGLPPAKRARMTPAMHARVSNATYSGGRFFTAGASPRSGGTGATGPLSRSSVKPTSRRVDHGRSTGTSSTPGTPVSQRSAGGHGDGSVGQPGAQSGGTGGGSGGPVGTPGQGGMNSGGAGNATPPPSSGGNGNGGQPPGQSVAGGGNGNGGQPPGQAVANGGNGNGGQPPGLSGSHGGNGNGGQPPGQSGSHGGNGNGGGGPHG